MHFSNKIVWVNFHKRFAIEVAWALFDGEILGHLDSGIVNRVSKTQI